LFGLVFGSFLNVCIHRMPLGLSVVHPRSVCPGCGAPIAGYDNIPVLSWVMLRGRCRHCQTEISPRYAVVELLTGVCFALSYYLPQTLTEIDHLLQAGKFCVLSFLLIGLIFTDAETRLLPDLLTKPGIVLGLLFSLVVRVEGPSEYFLFVPLYTHHLADWRIFSLLNSVAGAVAGPAFVLSAAMFYRALRGVEGMGRGDVKLMGLIGAFLGLRLTLAVLMIGSLLGTIAGMGLILLVWRKRLARRRQKCPQDSPALARKRAWRSATLIYRNFQLPFGVFLGAAALLAAFWGPSAIRWYWGLFW
jgi:leader peptidase (prepilin peptidase) / N-methyltransferase